MGVGEMCPLHDVVRLHAAIRRRSQGASPPCPHLARQTLRVAVTMNQDHRFRCRPKFLHRELGWMEHFFAVDVVAVVDDDVAAVAHSLLLLRPFCCPCLAALRVGTAHSVHFLLTLRRVHSKLELPEHAQHKPHEHARDRNKKKSIEIARGLGHGTRCEGHREKSKDMGHALEKPRHAEICNGGR